MRSGGVQGAGTDECALARLDGIVDEQVYLTATSGRVGHLLRRGDVQLDRCDLGVGHVLRMAGGGVDGARPPLDEGAGVSLPQTPVRSRDEGHSSFNLHGLVPFFPGPAYHLPSLTGAALPLTARRSVEHHPRLELVAHVLEAVLDTGSNEEGLA